jgi:uncharacterized membrane protein YkvA (DUF1232 family)
VGEKPIMDGDANLTKTADISPPSATPELMHGKPLASTGWKEQAQRLQKEAHVFYFVFKHPDTTWWARLVSVCTAAYLFSPVQLIPNYLPVVGVLDDVVVVFLGAKLIQRIMPRHVLTECRELADAAEARRKEKIKSTAGAVASIAIAAVWMFAAVIASVLVAAYFHHKGN